MEVYNNETGKIEDYEEYRKHEEPKFTSDLGSKKVCSAEDMMKLLIDTAEKGEHSEFQLITSHDAYEAVRKYAKSAKMSYRLFLRLEKRLTKAYAKEIKKIGKADVQTVFSIKKFDKYAEYYLKEREIAVDMLDEFLEYMRHGHILDMARGFTRSESDMHDFRDKTK